MNECEEVLEENKHIEASEIISENSEITSNRKSITEKILFVLGYIFTKLWWLLLLSIFLIDGLCVYDLLSNNYLSFGNDLNRDNYLIMSSPQTEYFKSLAEGIKGAEDNKQEIIEEETPLQNYYLSREQVLVIYESKSGKNIFTPHDIQKMKSVENGFKEIANTQSFCLSSRGECAYEYSVISVLNALNLDQSLIEDFIRKACTNEQLKYLFSKDTSVANPTSNIARSLYRFAVPIEWDGVRYNNRFDKLDKQKSIFSDVMSRNILDWSESENASISEIEVYVLGKDVLSVGVLELIRHDTYFILVSFVLILVYVTIHLRSIFLSCTGMIQVLLSVPLTFTIYHRVLGIQYNSLYNLVAIYILLGIGADNLFIFAHSWNKAKYKYIHAQRKQELLPRFIQSYLEPLKTVGVTESTTALAFFATAFCEITPIACFGVFSGLLVSVNYIVTSLIFPVLLILHTKYLECWSWGDICKYISRTCRSHNNRENRRTNSRISKFIKCQYLPFISRFKYIFILIFLIYIGISISFVVRIQKLSQEEMFFGDDLRMYRALQLTRNDFYIGPTEETIREVFVWGIKGIDKDKYSLWKPEKAVTVVWDEDFNIDSKQAQLHFLKVCQLLKENEYIRKDIPYECFMDYFKEWVLKEEREFPVNNFAEELLRFGNESSWGSYFQRGNKIGVIEGKLKFLQITDYTTIPLNSGGLRLLPAYKSFENLLKEINFYAPEGVNKAFQTARYGSWAWIESESALISNAKRGILVALAFSFGIILLATLSLSLAITVTFLITSVILCTLAFIQYFGWEFGVSESISSIVLIGLSVDYVVHIAAYYSYSKAKITYTGKTNIILAKVEDSLSNMAISIIGAALTTLIAAFPLYFCKIIPFFKFGVLITAIVLLSMLFALLLFPLICIICYSNEHTDANWDALLNEDSAYFSMAHTIRDLD